MYCLQWLIPVLLLSKPTSQIHLQNQIVFTVLYLISCCIERKPCMICLFLFVITTLILCSPSMGTYNLLTHDDVEPVCS